MKKFRFIFYLLVIGLCLVLYLKFVKGGEIVDGIVRQPDYARDRLRFTSQESDNLLMRRLTSWTTGYYALAVYDITQGTETIRQVKIIGTIESQDIRYKNKVISGMQGDLFSSATVYFYGYGTSFLVSADGGDVYYTVSWMGGTKRVKNGTGIGDNFEILASSPTYIYISLSAGTTAGYYLRGLIDE